MEIYLNYLFDNNGDHQILDRAYPEFTTLKQSLTKIGNPEGIANATSFSLSK
jgi:hypothetical protein